MPCQRETALVLSDRQTRKLGRHPRHPGKDLFDVVRRILSLRQRLECARLSAEYPRHVVRHDWNATRKDVDVLTRRALLEP